MSIQRMSKFGPVKGCCHRISLVRPLPEKVKGVKQFSCDHIVLYENIPARIGESRSIEENRLQDNSPPLKKGQTATDERVILACPRHPLSNLRAGDWVLIPFGNRPNTASPVFGLNGVGPNIWINTPNGNELLTWTCKSDGTCSFQGSIEIYPTEDNVWCMDYEGQTHCFSNSNFTCSRFPDGYSFIESTGPNLVYKILKIDTKEDHLCNISHYSIFAEFYDQEQLYPQS